MTIERINLNQNQLQFAFRSRERPYLQALTTRANYLLDLIVQKQASKEERLEYQALKWALQELIEVDLERINSPKP